LRFARMRRARRRERETHGERRDRHAGVPALVNLDRGAGYRLRPADLYVRADHGGNLVDLAVDLRASFRFLRGDLVAKVLPRLVDKLVLTDDLEDVRQDRRVCVVGRVEPWRAKLRLVLDRILVEKIFAGAIGLGSPVVVEPHVIT